jgi:hypothetical protein
MNYKDVEAKLKEASRYAPLEKLGACPQVLFIISFHRHIPFLFFFYYVYKNDGW